MTRISVCMATHNGEKFVSQQVASILPQLGEDDELIVSDDASTDDTMRILEQFADPRIKRLVNQPPHSATRNFENALRYATGTYIFLSDQDDVWYAHKVSTLLKYLEHTDLVVSNCDFIDENGRLSNESFFEQYHSGAGVLKNLLKNTFLGNCMAFRRCVLERALPFPPELHRATHYQIYQDVWIGVLANTLFRVTFVSEKLSGFRRHEFNASPTGISAQSTQSISHKLRGRGLLLASLLKRVLKIA